MRCSKCGKEFGTGTHCQHCGVDRVTGLANYNGFEILQVIVITILQIKWNMFPTEQQYAIPVVR